MNDEIKVRTKEQQAIDNLKAIVNSNDKIIEIEPPIEDTAQILLDYITNLQQENERLKQVMLVKQYYSETLPEGTEFVVLTKENYDRQQKDIQLELIDYKSRCEKAIEYINHAQNYGTMAQVMPHLKPYVNGDDLLNILQGSEDNE